MTLDAARNALALVDVQTYKPLLRMCGREQRGDDLRRAVRDIIRDENFEEHAAPSHRLDFEIFLCRIFLLLREMAACKAS